MELEANEGDSLVKCENEMQFLDSFPDTSLTFTDNFTRSSTDSITQWPGINYIPSGQSHAIVPQMPTLNDKELFTQEELNVFLYYANKSEINNVPKQENRLKVEDDLLQVKQSCNKVDVKG